MRRGRSCTGLVQRLRLGHRWGLYITLTDPEHAARAQPACARRHQLSVPRRDHHRTGAVHSGLPYEYRQAAGPVPDGAALTVTCPANGLLAVSLLVR